jgi:hypothetical protein
MVNFKTSCVRRSFGSMFLAGLLISTYGGLPAQPTSPTEYEVKAAFLYNFAKFVEWPPEATPKAGGSFVIGILGQDPFGKDLEDQFSGKSIQDKKVVFTQLSGLQEAAGCQVVFISASETDQLGTILGTLRTPPVLTVSDMDQFIQRGGMLGFTIDKSRVRFNVNLTAAEKAGFKISSQLLKLAKTVNGKPMGGGN